MKVAEIRGMAVDEMEQKVEELKKELLNLRIELKIGKLEKHARIRDVRKSVARLLTILREERARGTSEPDEKSKKVSK